MRQIKELVGFLRANLNVFAGMYLDVCSIIEDNVPRTECESEASSCKSKKHILGPERSVVLKEEVDKLKANGFIRDALYPEWVSNPV